MKKAFYFIPLLLFLSLSFQRPIQKKNNGSTLITFYHKSFHGKRTASGERLDNNKFTAAHQSLPFGTRVLLTNPRNHNSVIVTINDRGRLPRGVQFDLTRAAFKKLGAHGNGYLRVKYEVLAKRKLKKRRSAH